jgi:hypothetical protein
MSTFFLHIDNNIQENLFKIFVVMYKIGLKIRADGISGIQECDRDALHTLV